MKKVNKNVESEYIQKVALEHQLEEWKILNEYLNNIDIGYQQSITIVVSVFAIVATVLSQSQNSQWKWGIFIIPLGLVAFFSYVSYQFRITAILRGHLAALEESMNRKIHENVHMWNSALVETFMAHNNTINSMMMIPIIGFLVFVLVYCLKITYYLLVVQNGGINFGIVWFSLYWLIVTIFMLIVFIPFLKNEAIRYETFHEDRVWNKYNEYKKLFNCRSNFNYEPIGNKSKKNKKY